MSAALQADVVALEKELNIYQPVIPKLLELDDTFINMLDKTPSDPASGRSTRIQLLNYVGGKFQQSNMDDADLGGTSGSDWLAATLVPNYYTFGVGYSKQVEYATQGSERAVANPVQQMVSNTAKQFRSALDMLANTGGSGVLGTVTSYSNPNATMTTDGFLVELFYVGMPIQVFASTLATDRGSTTVIAIDRINNIITFAADVSGTTGGDFIVIEGLSATITIQSSLFGIPYHQNNATSGLWLGLNRATYPNIRTPSVNANTSALTTAPLRLATNLIKENIGVDAIKSGDARLTVYWHPAQADAYEALAITISQIFKNPSGNQGVDLLFGNDTAMTVGNIPTVQSIHASRTRIDFLCLSYWGRIVGTDLGMYTVGGQNNFPRYNSGGDGLFSSQFFYYKYGLQIYSKNPLAGAYIYSLAKPAGY